MDPGGVLKAALPCLLITLLAAAVVQARVFSRRPAAAGTVSAALQTLGGMTVYTAPLRINGTEATLRVTGFDDPLNTLAGEIRTALGLPLAVEARSDTLHTVYSGDTVTRLLLLRPAPDGPMLAITLEQSLGAWRESHRAPLRHTLNALPAYPGSTPGFYAENRDTGLRLATLTTPAAAEQIIAFYLSRLASDGWQPAFPSPDPGSAHIFLRAGALCFVVITPIPDSTGQHITLLHKSMESFKQ